MRRSFRLASDVIPAGSSTWKRVRKFEREGVRGNVCKSMWESAHVKWWQRVRRKDRDEGRGGVLVFVCVCVCVCVRVCVRVCVYMRVRAVEREREQGGGGERERVCVCVQGHRSGGDKISSHTYEWCIMEIFYLHEWMRRMTHINEPLCTHGACEYGVWQIRMRHVLHMNEHVTHMNTCHTSEEGMSRTWMRHVARMEEE